MTKFIWSKIVQLVIGEKALALLQGHLLRFNFGQTLLVRHFERRQLWIEGILAVVLLTYK